MNEHLKKRGDFKVAIHPTQESNWYYDNYEKFKELFPGDPIEHRQIFNDEIILDLDDKDVLNVKEKLDKIIKYLDEECWSYQLWNTGSLYGYHFHLYFPQLESLDEFNRSKFKEKVTSQVEKGTNCKFDNQLCGNHLIRAEFGRYEKSKKKAYKTLIKSKRYTTPNKINYEKVSKELKPVKLKFDGKKPLFPCNKFFLKGNVKEGRKRSLFIITSLLKQQGKSNKIIYQRLRKYVERFNTKKRLTISDYTLRQMACKPMICYVGCTYQRKVLEDIGQTKVCKDCPLKERYRRE